ncbi:MAG: hypothetical protein ACR2I0_15535, partial [Rhodoferax sp.]
HMQLAYNRTGAAVNADVATSSGWVAISELLGETRLRGYASAEVAGVLALEGDLFIESATNQTVTLSDSSTATVDTLLLGGAGLSAAIKAAGVGLALSDTDIALVVASEQGSGTRRWLTTTAAVGSAQVSGFDLAQVNSALLDINRGLLSAADTSGDFLAPATAAVIDWSKTPRIIAVTDSKALPLTQKTATFATAVSGSLNIGTATVSGSFQIILNRDASSAVRSWEIRASAAQVVLQTGQAKASIENATGSLFLAASGNSGQLSGTGAVSGIDGLTLSGALSARFNQNTLELAGSVGLGVSGLGDLSGQFSFVKQPASLSVPVQVQSTATAGASGSSSQTLQGGSTTDTLLTLALSDSSGKFTREGVYGFVLNGQTFTASSLDGDAASARPVSDAVFAQRIQDALSQFSAIGAGNVEVSGSRSAGFSIHLMGAMSGKALAIAAHQGDAGLWLVEPADPVDKPDWGLVSQDTAMQAAQDEVQQLSLASSGGSGKTFTLSLGSLSTAPISVLSTASAVNARQVLTLSGVYRASGQFWFSLDGKTSTKVRYSSDPTYHTSEILAALESLVGVGNVSVSYVPQYTGNNSIDYLIDFKGALAGKGVSLLKTYTSSSGITLSVAQERIGSPGFAVQDQARVIRQALEASLGVGNVLVNYDTASTLANARYDIEFTGALAGQDLATLVAAPGANVSGLTLALATTTQGLAAHGSVQTVHLYDEQVVGTFTLSLDYLGTSYTSTHLAFNASASEVRTAMLEAVNGAGQRFSATGAEISVALVGSGAQRAWQLSFGGSVASYDFALLQGRITSTVIAPEATLTSVQQGATSNERQTLNVSASGRYCLSLDASSETSVVLDASATAAQLQAALGALAGVGAGNVTVSGTDGVFLIDFAGALAGRDVAAVLLSPVQSVSLAMPDGQAPTAMALRFTGVPQWSAQIDITGLSQAQIATRMQALIATFTDLNADCVSVAPRAGQPYHFDVSFTGALAGATQKTLQALSVRVTEVQSERILIGAASVAGALGNGTAGVSFSDGRLGLVLQKNAAGQTGYALLASGNAALSGFGGDVNLSASAELRINTLGAAVSCSVPTGLSTPVVQVTFADGMARKELSIASGAISIANLGTLTGAIKI